MSTQRIRLSGVQLKRSNQVYTLSMAVLVVEQQWISVGAGERIPGMKSWTLTGIEDEVADLIFSSGEENFTFSANGYAGECFPISNTTLKGTGPIKGLQT